MDSNSVRKRWYEEVEEGEEKIYKFRVLLPDGLSVGVILNQVNEQMSVEKFLEHVKREYVSNLKEEKPNNSENNKKKLSRKIDWMNPGLYVQDVVDDCKWGNEVCFERYEQNRWNLLRLDDGQQNPAKKFKGMWDVTPNIPKLPDSYSFLTALSDIIDNSLQAVWLNNDNERRMISVDVKDDRILIADTGPGMDGVGENSLAKWGKMGLALHRFSGTQDTRRKRPYLEPSFGMFGYGGPAALMRLGRRAIISSKMKNSNKVYILDMKREALLHSSGEMSWKISGGVRDPLEDELSSPHKSFTKVEIYQLEEPAISAFKLQCCLKDIYYPYIQNDELTTAKTSGPVEFKVNGEDLARIQGGEVAITNLHSCNGPEFVVQLHLSYESKETSGSRSVEANARLKFVYFPIRDGEESLNKILEKLEADGCGVSRNFDTFCRVSIRQLGRLLPDASWPGLPFMDLKLKKGDKVNLLKRCGLRVKCFIDTDVAFNPNPFKNNLGTDHPFSTALKNFGADLLEKDGIKVQIYKDQKHLNLQQLEKEYESWILQMHDAHDIETGCAQDQPDLNGRNATTTTVLPFNGGCVLAADCRSNDGVRILSHVVDKIRKLGNTRAITLAGAGDVAIDVARTLNNQLSGVEYSNGNLETVRQSAEYIVRYFASFQIKPEVAFFLVGWDTLAKEGPPVIYHANQSYYFRANRMFRVAGCGAPHAEVVLLDENYEARRATMTEEEAVRIAELTVLGGARNSWKTGSNMDVCILRDGGEIVERPRQSMEAVAIKYNFPVESLQQP